MRGTIALLLALILAASVPVRVMPIKAEARTIIVPQDYQSLQVAIANANNGDVIFVKEGTHEGPVNQTIVIDKAISIVGENANNTVINLHPAYNVTWILTTPYFDYTDAIRIEANDVILFNLTLRFMGDIRVNGERAQIMRNVIWSHSTVTGLIIHGSNCTVADNFVLGRISIESASNIVAQNEFYSLLLTSANHNLVESNEFNYMGLESSGYNTVSKNNVSTELVWSAVSLRSSSNNVFHYNNITVSLWNTNLVIGYDSHDNAFYWNAFFYDYSNLDVNPDLGALYNSKKLVETDTTVYNNSWDNGKEGNYWQNYNGTDINGDGIGDTPYVIDGNNTDAYPLMRPLSFSGTTPSSWQTPEPRLSSPPKIKIVSPVNQTYNISNVPLIFTIDKQANWTGYSLDGQDNVTIAGNTTLAELANGLHNITVYAKDEIENVGASETISFSVEVPFPVVPVAAASAATVAVAVAGLLVYFKKRKR